MYDGSGVQAGVCLRGGSLGSASNLGWVGRDTGTACASDLPEESVAVSEEKWWFHSSFGTRVYPSSLPPREVTLSKVLDHLRIPQTSTGLMSMQLLLLLFPSGSLSGS